jgi:integrase
MQNITQPDHPDNPWDDLSCRYRNSLIVDWLLYLGLRRGELLGIRIPDINFQQETVTVHRRADDPDDPRLNQPNAKTLGRVIPISRGLLDRTKRYVLDVRAKTPGARAHTFLFVASHAGRPLSLQAVNKLFRVLRSKCPSAANQSITPHGLRHTWNERFSEEMDRNQISDEKESRQRSYLMGWSYTSETAATYQRRRIREKANVASLKLQDKFSRGM